MACYSRSTTPRLRPAWRRIVHQPRRGTVAGRTWWRLPALLLCLPLLGACSTLAYYSQAVGGQWQLMQQERPVTRVIDDPDSSAALRRRLLLVQQLLDFAHRQLLLPDNGSYRDYADLGRPYVAWNVFAAPELSMRAREWCYLFIGCLTYRGYFSPERARDYAAVLQRQGWEVYVGGVSAYSTLGWLRDPVLNTMLEREDWELARLLFHELAHQKVYLRQGGEVNEAVAETVARLGLQQWLATRPAAQQDRAQAQLAHEDALNGLLLAYRRKLVRCYSGTRPEAQKRACKGRLYAALAADYRRLRRGWAGDSRFDAWMGHGLNNAKLVAVATYQRLVPGLMAEFRALGSDWTKFYNYLEGLDKFDHAGLLRELDQRQKVPNLSGSAPVP